MARDQEFLDTIRGTPCYLCGKAGEPFHCTSVGAGGKDNDTNVLSMCREQHSEFHQLGWSKFIKKYPKMQEWLEERGRWDIIEKANRLNY